MSRLFQMRNLGTAVLTACALFAGSSAYADFNDFVIRGAAQITHPVAGQTQIVLDQGGEKAALGSSDIDGKTLGSITSLKITRLDDITRFGPTNASGQARAPYLNFWITDGAGHFAVVANEPTNPEWNSLYSGAGANGFSSDLSFSDMAGMTVKIYEVADKSWLPNAGANLKFSDLAGFMIQAPTADELNTGWVGLTGGAPRELDTNVAYGVNWVFGDTLSNYVAGEPGYIVSDASVEAGTVPEPGSLALVGLALAGLAASARVRKSKTV